MTITRAEYEAAIQNKRRDRDVARAAHEEAIKQALAALAPDARIMTIRAKLTTRENKPVFRASLSLFWNGRYQTMTGYGPSKQEAVLAALSGGLQRGFDI